MKAAGANIFAAVPTSPAVRRDLSRAGNEGLDFLGEAKKLTGLPSSAEISITATSSCSRKNRHHQIGARTYAELELLKDVGATTSGSAERGLSRRSRNGCSRGVHPCRVGTKNVMLCERRHSRPSNDSSTANTLDLRRSPAPSRSRICPSSSIPPCYGERELVAPMAKAAVAAGAAVC